MVLFKKRKKKSFEANVELRLRQNPGRIVAMRNEQSNPEMFRAAKSSVSVWVD